jgi:DNA polymerase-3 subunit gamma/tau
MNYIPLARKWRPKCFADFVGQDHIVLPLQNALSQNKLHHAYLFTGTRGVGKTTVARIFAKALNCQVSIINEPCLKCDNCLAIDEGRFFDLIEVDGASRTRVEDTRELIENIQYSPSVGRFKIFIIDEVHMLSTHSFNALLKTLEEPPPHVKFLLATTDPQKIPATILSRCIQFNLKAMTNDIIVKQLSHILDIEHFKYDIDALNRIANSASGSMRDALTLCEQMMAVFPEGLTGADLKQFIGASLEDYSINLLNALSTLNILGLLDICKTLAQQQTNFERLILLLLSSLHACVIEQIHPSTNCPDVFKTCSQRWSAQVLHTLYLIAEKGLQDLNWAPNHAVGFEMLILRMAQYIKLHAPDSTLIQEDTQPLFPNPEPLLEEVKHTPVLSTPEPIAIHAQQSSTPEEWHRIVSSIKIDGIGKSALNHSTFIEKKNDSVVLEIHKKNESLFTPMIKERIQQALSDYYQHPIKIKLQYLSTDATAQTPAVIQEKNQQAEKAELIQNVHEHPMVQRILNEYNGEIIENSMTKVSNDL